MLVLSHNHFDAILFDLDGVITRTAAVHAAAWQAMFDEFLQRLTAREGQSPRFRPFDVRADYAAYVDGKPRYAGVQSFLESRDIHLPYGDPDDPPTRETVCGLGNLKNEMFLKQIHQTGVKAFPASVRLLHKLRAAGFKTAIVSSSESCQEIIQSVGIEALFDTRVDGRVSAELGLKGKPNPDIFVQAAKNLAVDLQRAVVVEDALSGVEAGRAGGFGLVLGVDRLGQAAALKAHGADVVINDLCEVSVEVDPATVPHIFDCFEGLITKLRRLQPAVFLDYDGTLTPIVSDPKAAVLNPAMREAITRLARRCRVAIISGRDLADVEHRVGIPTLVYAGSHGFEILLPDPATSERQVIRKGDEFSQDIAHAEHALQAGLAGIPGALVERKQFSVAAHYRNVSEADQEAFDRAVEAVVVQHPRLRRTLGKKVYDLQPDIPWHKGAAVRFLLETLKLDQPNALPIYIGDDVTDEDAFAELIARGTGIGIHVGQKPDTQARYRVNDVDEVGKLLARLTQVLEEG